VQGRRGQRCSPADKAVHGPGISRSAPGPGAPRSDTFIDDVRGNRSLDQPLTTPADPFAADVALDFEHPRGVIELLTYILADALELSRSCTSWLQARDGSPGAAVAPAASGGAVGLWESKKAFP
jgi:hypothetical protein